MRARRRGVEAANDFEQLIVDVEDLTVAVNDLRRLALTAKALQSDTAAPEAQLFFRFDPQGTNPETYNVVIINKVSGGALVLGVV